MQEKTFYTLAILFQPLVLGLMILAIASTDFCRNSICNEIIETFYLYFFTLSLLFYPLYLLFAIPSVIYIRGATNKKRLIYIWVMPLIFSIFLILTAIGALGAPVAIIVGYVNISICFIFLVIARKLSWVTPDKPEENKIT